MATMSLDEIPYDECLELLRFEQIGRIGIVVNDAPVIVPVNYRLVESLGHVWVAFRTRAGNLLEIIVLSLDQGEFVIHAMKMRPAYRRMLP